MPTIDTGITSTTSAVSLRAYHKGHVEGREEGHKEGREEGRKEGREEGREEGRTEERYASARKMKADGMTAELIAKYTGLTAEEIAAL